MAVKHVQLRLLAAQREASQQILLDGVRFRVRGMYSALGDRWYITLRDLSDVVIVGPLALVPGVDLLLPYKHLAIPQGELFLQSITRTPATIDSLDVSATLLYREVAT